MQHGRALKRYVETAWPDFAWDDAYRDFLAEFLRFCSVDQLASTRALELAARCVVETGTAAGGAILSASDGKQDAAETLGSSYVGRPIHGVGDGFGVTFVVFDVGDATEHDDGDCINFS